MSKKEPKHMPTEKPKISVVIPVKNGETKIANCLSAVFSQTYSPFEVIVVDGHSKDRTVEVASKYRVKILYEDYNTIGGARQVGLEHASGEFVAYTDADCIPERGWLQNLVKAFENSCVGVGGGIKNVGNGFWQKSIALAMNTYVGSANSVQGRLFKEKQYVNSISGCNSMYRKEILIKVGGFDTSLSINEDTELNKRVSKFGKLLYVPNAIVLHDHSRLLMDFAKRMYQFGEGRGKLRLLGIQCLPPLIAPLLFFFIFARWLLFLIGAYAVVLIGTAATLAMQEKSAGYLVSIPVVFLIEHFFYILGFWVGLLKKHGK